MSNFATDKQAIHSL